MGCRSRGPKLFLVDLVGLFTLLSNSWVVGLGGRRSCGCRSCGLYPFLLLKQYNFIHLDLDLIALVFESYYFPLRLNIDSRSIQWDHSEFYCIIIGYSPQVN